MLSAAADVFCRREEIKEVSEKGGKDRGEKDRGQRGRESDENRGISFAQPFFPRSFQPDVSRGARYPRIVDGRCARESTC